MELINILIIASAVIVLLLLWIIVGVRHLKHLKREVYDQWDLVMDSLRKRADMVPNLIETVRVYVQGQEEILAGLIRVRRRAALEYIPGAKKIEYENDLSLDINKVKALAGQSGGLATDTNFLELKKEIDDITVNAIEQTKKHNEMVRYYNRHRKLLLLRPLAKVFGYGGLNIFEMEV